MIRIAVLAAALVAAVAQAQVPGVSTTTVRIGQSTPLTGSNAELGNDIRNGALAYFRKVNDAGGVHGRHIELITLDDGNQVPRAEANTKKLVEDEPVFALFGYPSASSTSTSTTSARATPTSWRRSSITSSRSA